MNPRLKMAMMQGRKNGGEYYTDWEQSDMPHDMKSEHKKAQPMSGAAYRKGSKERAPGMSYGSEGQLNPMEANEWVASMENADGTTGEHYSMEQVYQIMEQQKIPCDKVEFYAAMNMMYSDYCKVAKKFNCSTPEFYACLAKAFLEDKDAEKGKLKRYYECIVKH